MPTREKFVERFGEKQAVALETAADSHRNGVNDANIGGDPFKWALLIIIGHECASNDEYRKFHGITVPWDELDKWMIEHADLGSHDGDVDYLALLVGRYNRYVSQKDTPNA